MVEVLSDPDLYIFTGGEPPTLGGLEERYRFQVEGSPREDEVWHNWIVRHDGVAIGYVQATVTGEDAELAWVVGTQWQGRGFAREAAAAMKRWLADEGALNFSAHIHPDHHASAGVAIDLGLHPSGQLDEDGEMIWRLAPHE